MERQVVRMQEEDGPCFHPRLPNCSESKITFFTGGGGLVNVAGAVNPFAAGDILFIPGCQPHIIRFIFEGQLTGLSLYFNNSSSPSALFSVPEIRRTADLLSRYSSGFKISGAASAAIAKKFFVAKGEQGLQLLIKFLELLMELYRCENIVSLAPEKNNNFQFEGERIRRAVEYIYQNFSRSISLSEMAEMAHLTKESFCRYFKQHTGHSLADFTNEIRIEEVCRRLCAGQTSMVISEVAYECGFRNMSHFNKTFRVLMGTTPHQYMQSKRMQVAL
ncbi:AraC family transcriptional regulator [Arcticibacter tournemirensis]|uniref:AraC family transcriptional regulator n=2 Tax=Pseudomonadati TaxID=3379134 RepID=A0A4Q0MC59_9SPHI|nr:AraC family transcriptional regulator [Arcticibacter tournemirensis]RXF70366.1 AraC family transcriptional regulator [Arcticibacter tournemirensis]